MAKRRGYRGQLVDVFLEIPTKSTKRLVADGTRINECGRVIIHRSLPAFILASHSCLILRLVGSEPRGHLHVPCVGWAQQGYTGSLTTRRAFNTTPILVFRGRFYLLRRS